MTSREVPVVASWLLKKFVRGAHSESLLGDLLEEYQTGRAPGWYWWETLVALLHALRRDGRGLFSRRTAYFISALAAQCLLLVCFLGLSEQHLGDCRALPSLLGATTVPVLWAGAAEVAIVVVTWLGLFANVGRAGRQFGLLRLLVLAFAAVGLGGGALTWAGTAGCQIGPRASSHSSVADSCALPGNASPQRRSSEARPARTASRADLR